MGKGGDGSDDDQFLEQDVRMPKINGSRERERDERSCWEDLF